MAFSDPGTGCVTTANSAHCRTELSEVNTNGKGANWSPNGTNTLNAEVKVNNSGGQTVVGQIHLEESVSNKPLVELYYESNGDVVAGVEQTKAGGDEVMTTVGHVNAGSHFTYELNYSNNKLQVTVNGKTTTLSTYSVGGIDCYFKAGDYGQTTSASKVFFYSLSIHHS